MLIRDTDEMFIKIGKEFTNLGFEKIVTARDELTFIQGSKTVIVCNDFDCIQIHTSFAHDWSVDLFPDKCVMSIIGMSIFYYGRLEENEQ